ncbi:hypothetical protein RFI_02209 [Reticulomyxa filosa]|uniref:Uncharacterized protein n=1 Tax=Reticulomyxa filosa TaxID=46433 RepID=X6P9V0_RETFI|nr:hypothetical protein RFI_02209 [Reticulomyxa filosa]|eukprot:ETO34878.1 hypothetical protein RFI_02209 [Reticulomyxa filosa]
MHNQAFVTIGKLEDDLRGARAVIGGVNKNLLFITYRPSNIDVFSLETYTYLKKLQIPESYTSRQLSFHCIVLYPPEDDNESEPVAQNTKMLLVCRKFATVITFDEENENVRCEPLSNVPGRDSHQSSAYVYASDENKKDSLLLIGGYNETDKTCTAGVVRYSFKFGQWYEDKPLPYNLSASVAVHYPPFIYIFGGNDGYELVADVHRVNRDHWIAETQNEREMRECEVWWDQQSEGKKKELFEMEAKSDPDEFEQALQNEFEFFSINSERLQQVVSIIQRKKDEFDKEDEFKEMDVEVKSIYEAKSDEVTNSFSFSSSINFLFNVRGKLFLYFFFFF